MIHNWKPLDCGILTAAKDTKAEIFGPEMLNILQALEPRPSCLSRKVIPQFCLSVRCYVFLFLFFFFDRIQCEECGKTGIDASAELFVCICHSLHCGFKAEHQTSSKNLRHLHINKCLLCYY